MSYARSELKNGDLLGWRHVHVKNKGEFFLNVVRIATFSDFGHVSIVWNKDGVPQHVEATQPKIIHRPIPKGEAFVIPLGLDLSDADMHSFFHDKIGLKYSFRDALMGYLGKIPVEEDRYQCAELSLEFMRMFGCKVPDAYTPSRLMRRTMQHTAKPMYSLSR